MGLCLHDLNWAWLLADTVWGRASRRARHDRRTAIIPRDCHSAPLPPAPLPQHSPWAPQPPVSFGLVHCCRPSKPECFPWRGLAVPSCRTSSTQNKHYLTAQIILERCSVFWGFFLRRGESVETDHTGCLRLLFLDGPRSLCMKCEIQTWATFQEGHGATVTCAVHNGVVTSVKLSMQRREMPAHWGEVSRLGARSPQRTPS